MKESISHQHYIYTQNGYCPDVGKNIKMKIKVAATEYYDEEKSEKSLNVAIGEVLFQNCPQWRLCTCNNPRKCSVYTQIGGMATKDVEKKLIQEHL